MSRFRLLAAVAAISLAAPAMAQMDHSNMPGMKMPPKPAPAKPAAKPKPKPAPKAKSAAKPTRPVAKPATPAAAANCTPEHAAMGHCTLPAPQQGGMADMPGMAVEGNDPNQRVGGAQEPAPKPSDPDCPPEHAKMGHCTPKTATGEQAMSGMDMGQTAAVAPAGTDLPPGDAPAPAPPEPAYADRVWGREAMQPTRDDLRREHGGGTFSQVMFNLAEYQARKGRDGFRWDGEAWFGGDLNKLVVKSEGKGAFGEGVDDAEVQALYSRTIGPYFNLQAGVRHDFKPNPARTYATIGVEGLAPYWFEVEGALFLSDKGDVLARFEGYYDQRITQRLILQPRVEMNFAAQDVPENGIGSGLSDIELGLRLRYEIKREFAPYIGISWDRAVGDTARFARAAGEDPSSFSAVAGVRIWF